MPVSFSENTKPLRLPVDVLRFLRRLAGKRVRPAEPFEELQNVIGYRFRSLDLLKQSLTHKSAVAAEDTMGLYSNERLEFLGDAVLNCLVTEYLYLRHPGKSEGQLSKIKSLVVSRKILGEIAQSMHLGDYLIFGPSEEKSGGRNRLSTMSNAFEAVLGAVYLDAGLQDVKKLLGRFLFGRIPEFLRDERHMNYKSKILELSQRDGFGIPHYTTVEAVGPDHAKTFTVQIDIGGVALGRGTGSNKKIAQQHAAQQALEKYDKDTISSSHKGVIRNELVSD
ncbi:MAG: ribonuclease III [Chitinispirillaceae bacterium]|nr:ribonuclease III [Chitinispirillaceae bacterium]